ncbi:MAG: siphovirus Gp157 family protein [Candidatus Riflebacteria bacterium]|nr:siphovirus Gp157 family protein [Candidatus Riflebacteria bacterium]
MTTNPPKVIEHQKLYQIADRLNTIIESVIERGGEITESEMAALQQWKYSFQEKVASVCWMMQKLDADIANAKAIEERAKQYRKVRENIKDRIRKYLAWSMETADQKSVTVDIYKVILMAGKERVVVSDPNLLPRELVEEVVKVDLKPKTDEIKALLTQGIDVPGAVIESGESFVTIR